MCGIYGYSLVDKPSPNAADIFADILKITGFAMSFRGTDSWGWTVIDKERSVMHRKGLGDCSKYPWGVPPSSWSAAIGHTRWATVGDVTVANAHPFVRGSVHGAHNGSIYNYEEIAAEMDVDVSVDSDVLIHCIARMTREGFPKGKLEGYGAVTWLDESTGIPYVCRMEAGDLEMVSVKFKNEPGRYLLWASEFRNIMSLADKRPVIIKKLPKLSEGVVYAVVGGQMRRTGQNISLSRFSYLSSWGEAYDEPTWMRSHRWNKNEEKEEEKPASVPTENPEMDLVIDWYEIEDEDDYDPSFNYRDRAGQIWEPFYDKSDDVWFFPRFNENGVLEDYFTLNDEETLFSLKEDKEGTND